MSRRPIILSFTTAMHEAGMNLLREGSELRIASSLKPETLRHEVVDADALVIRTGGEVDAALMDCGRNLKVVGRHGVGFDQIDVDAISNDPSDRGEESRKGSPFSVFFFQVELPRR